MKLVTYKAGLTVALTLLLSSCVSMPQKNERMVAAGHINEALPAVAKKKADIPPIVTRLPVLTPPKPTERLQTFTVVVADVPAHELLFALARDARLNLDIDPNMDGRVSLNAIDQTLPQILNRISRQIDLRYYIDGPTLVVEIDKPFMHIYSVDYLNIARTTTTSTSLTTKIAATGIGGGATGNDSSTRVNNVTNNNFWESLEKNIDAMVSDGAVISNRESGYISVLANSKEHANIQKFLDKVLNSARRQVLIEATVVEITLNDDFQAGVDWSKISSDIGDGFSFAQGAAVTTNPANALSTSSSIFATYRDVDSRSTVSASITALSEFGDVAVMSSPKIMALNNQTSVLKVVNNTVYFTTKIERKAATDNAPAETLFTTTIHTVPVGFVMNVTPFITKNDEVILNVRPTISRIVRFIPDPTPGLAVQNNIPEIQVREMESVLRVADGETAVIGGLMQDSSNKTRSGLPGLSEQESFGFLFGQQERNLDKTELVIFLRPRVIKNASINGELKDFKRFLQPEAFRQ